jgi:RIO kinase 1
MKTPKRLEPLVEDGLVDEVISQLKSGKEATVYLVRCGNTVRCAKVYKDAAHRSFKQASVYREGRKVRNTRDARAMEKGSRFGRREQEDAWQNTEVSALYRLAEAGVRVPTPHGCFDGVLLMDLITDAGGNVAPRLSEIEFTAELAVDYHQRLLREVVRMLCAGIVHGDLSEYNILADQHGPVIIDLPQAIDASGNNLARDMLERDINNLAVFFGQFDDRILTSQYGKEIWAIYESGNLTEATVLTGIVEADAEPADIDGVLREIFAAQEEERKRLERLTGINDGE